MKTFGAGRKACDNQLVHADGSMSAYEAYYGHNTLDPRALLAYGAQGSLAWRCSYASRSVGGGVNVWRLRSQPMGMGMAHA